MGRSLKRRLTALALLCVAGLISAALLSVSALGVTIVTSSSVELVGEIKPSKLPRATRRPFTATLEGKFPGSGNGARPTAVKTLSLQFDREGAIFTKGLPICKLSPISEFSLAHVCQKALVGHGEFEVKVEPPEQPAFHAEAPMGIFNGPPQEGHPVLIYEAYIHIPAATTFITSGVIRGDTGRYGTQTAIPIPKFVSGAGSLTGFRATIGKAWSYQGKKVSLLAARCRKGDLLVHDEIEYVDGNEHEGDVEMPCTPAGPRAGR